MYLKKKNKPTGIFNCNLLLLLLFIDITVIVMAWNCISMPSSWQNMDLNHNIVHAFSVFPEIQRWPENGQILYEQHSSFLTLVRSSKEPCSQSYKISAVFLKIKP